MSITAPGIYEMDDATYHADPVEAGSLSSSGARTILKSPALYQWERQHPVYKDVYDVGHAVHAKVLGVGLDTVEIPADTLAANGATSTKAAKDFIAQARAEGKVPLKADVIAEINTMAESVLSHPLARALLERPGQSEASLFAPDPETGVWLRARIDRLPDAHPAGRTIAVDLKTGRSADPAEFKRSAADYGYDLQAEWYQAVLRQVRGDDDTAFVFIVVESTAPHLVSVIELGGTFPQIGRDRMRRAIDTFHHCRETGEWPGYDPVVHYVEPPRYYEIQNEEPAA